MIKILNAEGQLLLEFEGESLRDAMLANKYLKGAQLAGMDLSGANLDDADLSHANLAGAILSDVSFEKTKLIEADLSNAKLDGAVFWCSDLSKAKLSHSSAISSRFVGANLRGALAQNCNFENASFEKMDEQSWFQMNNADFSGSLFDGAMVSFADVTRTCFFGTDFSKSKGMLCGVTSHKDLENPVLYPTALRYSESAFNPFFDGQTKWPKDMMFPSATVPWLLVGKFACIALFLACAIATISDTLLKTDVFSSHLFWIAVCFCVALPLSWFWKRKSDINNEIERDPSLHYGRYVSLRDEYRLGVEMSDQEKEHCHEFR